MTTSNAFPKAKESSVSAVVTRADGRVENLGMIAYWHINPIKRLWWYLRHPKQWKYRMIVGPKATAMKGN
jgi:hypothetical protein